MFIRWKEEFYKDKGNKYRRRGRKEYDLCKKKGS